MREADRRLVIDTNVVFSALLSAKGASAELLRRVLQRHVGIALSMSVLLEYEEVLLSPSKLQLTGKTGHEVQNLLKSLAAVALPAPRRWSYRPMLSDPDDEIILEAAIGGGATDIVTFNSSDFTLPPWFGIMVVTPADVLRSMP